MCCLWCLSLGTMYLTSTALSTHLTTSSTRTALRGRGGAGLCSSLFITCTNAFLYLWYWCIVNFWSEIMCTILLFMCTIRLFMYTIVRFLRICVDTGLFCCQSRALSPGPSVCLYPAIVPFRGVVISSINHVNIHWFVFLWELGLSNSAQSLG